MGASVVSCGDTPSVLELGEHVLDFMALPVERFGLRQALRHFARPLMVAHLARREMRQSGSAILVTDGVQLGVQPAFGSPRTTGKASLIGGLRADIAAVVERAPATERFCDLPFAPLTDSFDFTI